MAVTGEIIHEKLKQDIVEQVVILLPQILVKKSAAMV